MELNVIAETNHFIVVQKPAGIPSQGDKTEDRDMLTLIKQYLKEKYQKPGNVYLGDRNSYLNECGNRVRHP